MAKWFTLITHQSLESDRLWDEEDQPGCAISAGKIERVELDRMLRSMGRNGAGGLPAGMRAGALARSAHGSAHERAGAGGEGAARARMG